MRSTYYHALALCAILISAASAFGSNPDGPLRIEITTAYNFIVDSNVETPSTYAPRSAFISARLWNDGTTDLTDVVARIGDRIANTPGIYPSRVHTENPSLVGPLLSGAFALTHEGGTMGTIDATRTFPTIPAGSYIPVYWLVSYPNLDENGKSVTGGIKPNDDLYLFYDIWAEAEQGATTYAADVRRRATMRNSISAMANKIFPNTANKVPQQYKDLLAKFEPEWNNVQDDGTAGTSIVTEGIWYDLGNVTKGFDNDGDLVPDQNAWLQPVGDPAVFDASSFRLARTYALIIVKLKSGGELVITARDQLYFTNLPDNTGVVGLVRYDFLPLKSNATSTITPYQMAASGFDNEKFNGDYGASVGTLTSPGTGVTLNKTVNLETATGGDTLAYTIDFANAGGQAVGDPSIGIPLVVQDAIPVNTTYVAGSAALDNTLPAGVGSYSIFYSVDGGTTWSASEPANAADVTNIQWWLSDPLAPAASGTVTFSVAIDDPIQDVPLILNTAGLSFGNTTPFLEDDAITLITGVLAISGTVFEDTGVGTGGVYGDGIINGTEPGLANVLVSLYFDTNGSGTLDAGDVLVATTNSGANGTYSFDNLPDGSYLVVVDPNDSDIPVGYTATNSTTRVVTLVATNSTGNNFGFAPTLIVTKSGTESVYEGEAVQYEIEVSNNYPVGGTQQIYSLWPTTVTTSTGNKAWVNPAGAQGPPDGNVASSPFVNASEELFTSSYSPIVPAGNITKVEIVIRARTQGFAPTDNSLLEFFVPGTSLAGNAPLEVTAPSLASATLVDFAYDITSTKANWNTTDFLTQTMQINTRKAGNPGVVLLELDAVAFRITTTETATLDPVPLTDTYNADELQFVSATPSPISTSVVGSVGTLSWSNIGPIAPGNSSTVTVNFIARSVPGGAPITTTDTATVTGATFENGTPANDGSATASTLILPTGAIGDTIFRDANRNGTQDLNEVGIPGVTVGLYQNDILIASRETDLNGNYLFTGLLPGTYKVVVVTDTGPLVGWELTADPDADGVPCDDPLAIGCDGEHTVNLIGGQIYTGADFGFFPPGGLISGVVWIDSNNDGIVDETEVLLPFITVELLNGMGDVLDTLLTDENGAYAFAGLTDGVYSVRVRTDVDFPVGLTQVYDPDSTLDNVASAIQVTGGEVISINGEACTGCGTEINFGYLYDGTNSLSGTVGIDGPEEDGLLNGLNPSGVSIAETPLADVTVYVYLWNDANEDGIVDAGETTLLNSIQTVANGDYSFTGLPVGAVGDSYIVSMVPPLTNVRLTSEALQNGHPAELVVESTDSQGFTTGAYMAVSVDGTITNMDFAFVSAVEYDFGDLPEAYADITLLPNGARHIVRAEPNLFLGAGVDTEPNGVISTDSTGDDFDDGVTLSGIWINGGVASVQVEVGAGSGWLVGYVDFNNDGDFLDAGDLIINAVPVSSTGGPASNGVYTFSFNVPEGTLSVEETTFLFSRFRLLPEEPFLPELAFTGEATNGEVEDYRFAFHVIKGTVYVDSDSTETFSAGDEPLGGVEIELYLDNVLVANTVSQLDGSYSFYGLPAGDYEVRSVTPVGATALLDADGSANGNDIIAVTITDDSIIERDFLVGQMEAPDVCLELDATLDAFFVRPSGLPGNVVYSIEYAATLGSPIAWSLPVVLDAGNTTVTDNGDGTESVVVNNLPWITGLVEAGFFRVRVDLDEIPGDAVFSDVLGWIESGFGIFCRSYNNPFLPCPTVVGEIVLVAGSTVTLDADADGLIPGLAYYIEVTNGDFEGHRFDVVTAAGSIVSLATTSDLCAFAAPHNTLAGDPPVDLVGATVILRAHRTLADVFPVDMFFAAGSADLADLITFHDGAAIICYWLYDDDGTARWVSLGDADLIDQGSTVVPPGRGAFVNSRSVKTLVSYGRVRANDFVLPLCEGKTLVGGGYPIDQSAAGRGMTTSSGFIGDPDYVFADQFLRWRGDVTPGANSYDVYYLFEWSTFDQWTRAADVQYTNQSGALLFISDEAIFIERRADLLNYTMSLPWAP